MLHETFIAPFADYEFMRRALVGAVALAISGSPLGVFLILRRMSLAGLAVALVSSAAARFTALREDASLAAFYLVSLALGVAIVSLKGSNVDLLHVLFGSVLALDDQTLIFLAGIASFTLLALAVAFRALALDTLDPLFARRVGRLGETVPFAFLALVVLNLVAGFHALGTLMAVGVIMLPAASARLWTQDLGVALPLAAAIGALSSYLGLVLSFLTGLPAGPVIILMAGAAYFLSLIFGRTGGVVRLRRPRRHLEG